MHNSRLNSKRGAANVWVMGLIALVFMAIPPIIYFTSYSQPSGWIETTGIVTSVEVTHDSDGDASYYPVIAFHSQNNVEHTVRSSISRNASVGSKIVIYYNPDNPHKMHLKAGTGDYLVMSVFLSIGVILLFLTIFSSVRSSRIRSLKSTGTKVTAYINNTAYSGVGNVTAVATLPNGLIKQYTLKNIGFVRSLILRSGQDNLPIDIYIDPNDHEKFYADLSSLPLTQIGQTHEATLDQNTPTPPITNTDVEAIKNGPGPIERY